MSVFRSFDFSFRLRFLDRGFQRGFEGRRIIFFLDYVFESKFHARWGWKFHRGRFIGEEGLSFGSRFRFWPTFDSLRIISDGAPASVVQFGS